MCLDNKPKGNSPLITIMLIHKSIKGKVEKIADRHFKITKYTELGYMIWEMRHTSKDKALYELNK